MLSRPDMHPCRQFPGHFVVHMPLCSFSCFVSCVPCPVIGGGGGEGTVTWGRFPWGCEGTVTRSRLLDNGGGTYSPFEEVGWGVWLPTHWVGGEENCGERGRGGTILESVTALAVLTPNASLQFASSLIFLSSISRFRISTPRFGMPWLGARGETVAEVCRSS